MNAQFKKFEFHRWYGSNLGIWNSIRNVPSMNKSDYFQFKYDLKVKAWKYIKC